MLLGAELKVGASEADGDTLGIMGSDGIPLIEGKSEGKSEGVLLGEKVFSLGSDEGALLGAAEGMLLGAELKVGASEADGDTLGIMESDGLNEVDGTKLGAPDGP